MKDLNQYNSEGSNLRLAQIRMLQIAKVFDSICKSNDITYWIISGTLLGARRHGGFIPWDDDFDVGVKLEDYDRLLDILKNDLPENLKLQTKETDPNHPFFYAKIRDINSVIREKGCAYRNYKYNGLFIDIFPFESICLSKRTKIIFDSFYNKFRFESKKCKIWRMISGMFFFMASTSVPFLRFFSKFTSDKYSHAYGIGFYAPHKLSNCFPVTEIKFEDYYFSAPRDVDAYLSEEFGNFMEIPPKEKRITHCEEIQLF